MAEKFPSTPTPEEEVYLDHDVIIEQEFGERPLTELYEATIDAYQKLIEDEFNFRNDIKIGRGVSTRAKYLKQLGRVSAMKQLIAKKKTEASE